MMYLFSALVSLAFTVYGVGSAILNHSLQYFTFILFFAFSTGFCFCKFRTRNEYGNNLNTTKYLLGFLFLSLCINEIYVWFTKGDSDLYLAFISFVVGIFFIFSGLKISNQLAALKIRETREPKK